MKNLYIAKTTDGHKAAQLAAWATLAGIPFNSAYSSTGFYMFMFYNRDAQTVAQYIAAKF